VQTSLPYAFGNGVGWIGPKTTGGLNNGAKQGKELQPGSSVEFRFRKLFKQGYLKTPVLQGAPSSKAFNDRVIMTTLYRFPTSAGFKAVLKHLYYTKDLPSEVLNKDYLKSQYDMLQTRVNGRKLATAQETHFFFTPNSWTAFNLPSINWYVSADGQATLSCGQEPAVKLPPPLDKRGGMKPRDCQERIMVGPPVKLDTTSHVASTYSPALSDDELDAKGEQDEKELKPSDTVNFIAPEFTFRDRPSPGGVNVMEKIVDSGWLRLGGPSGTTSDIMGMFFAFTKDAGMPGAHQTPKGLEKVKKAIGWSKGSGRGGKGGRKDLRKALMRFYMQSQLHSAMEVFLGAEPYLSGTPLSMMNGNAQKALREATKDTFAAKLNEALER
jgi:hypothetical protein